jgi:hypothetical protein
VLLGENGKIMRQKQSNVLEKGHEKPISEK